MQDTFNIRDESVFKAASGLHGGIGGKGDVCGALTGASLMLGLMFGSGVEESGKPRQPPTPGEWDVPTRMVGELYKWFKKEFGSVKCHVIRARHEKEVNAEPDASGLTEMEKMGRSFAKCNDLCGRTAARATEIILDRIQPRKKRSAR